MSFLFPKVPKAREAPKQPQAADASVIAAGQRQSTTGLIGRGIFSGSQGLKRKAKATVTKRPLVGGE